MSYPLGPRYAQRKKRVKTVTLKPPVDTYLANVSIPPHVVADVPSHMIADMSQSDRPRSSASTAPSGSAAAMVAEQKRQAAYAATCAHVLPVYLRTADDVACVIGKVWDAYRDKTGNELPRPPSAYVLCVCFADYTIDFTHRPLHGESSEPIMPFLPFPYYLSLQVNLYAEQRERLINVDEPQGRQGISELRRAFASFCSGYAGILRQLHQQRLFLLGRDADYRRTKMVQEQHERFDVAMQSGFRDERAERAALLAAEASAWDTTRTTARALLEHAALCETLYAQTRRALQIEHRVLRQQVETGLMKDALKKRLHQLVHCTLQRLFDDGITQHRAVYTASRVASGIRLAQHAEADCDLMDMRRVEAAKARTPAHYSTPALVNKDSILRDVFRSSRAVVGHTTARESGVNSSTAEFPSC